MNLFETLIAPACAALGIDPLQGGLQLLPLDALIPAPAPAVAEHERAWSEMQGVGPYQPVIQPFPLLPTRPALLCGTADLASVQQTLLSRYPAGHPVQVVSGGQVRATTVGELSSETAMQACYYLPPLDPLADVRGPDGVTTVVMRLLGPRGCPWDREQTHQSLRASLLEESHEVLETLDSGDTDHLAEELGDLLLQVLIHSEIARQANEFALGDVYAEIATKLIRRHPHVFGTTTADDTGTVLRNWDAIKQQERAAKGQQPRGALDGLPASLPALATAQKLTKKAAKQGFDWAGTDGVWQKFLEEVSEVAQAADMPETPERQQRLEAEIGDLLQIIAKLAWKYDIDAEVALRQANAKFRARFGHMEQQAAAQGTALPELSLDQLQTLWDAAKQDYR